MNVLPWLYLLSKQNGMKQVKHNSTGATFVVTKEGPKVFLLQCVTPGTCKGLYIGKQQKTSPAGLAAFYTEITQA